GRVGSRAMAGVDRRTVFGGEIRGIEDVLDADGQSTKRSGWRSRRGFFRARKVERGESADLGLARRDRLLAAREHGGGRQLSGFDAARQLERMERLAAGP